MSTYRQYMEFELRMTMDQVEVLAMRDPQVNNDDSAAELGTEAEGPGTIFPHAAPTTGTPEGDQRRWLREHNGADADAPMEVKVLDIRVKGSPASGWLTLDQVDAFIAKGRAT